MFEIQAENFSDEDCYKLYHWPSEKIEKDLLNILTRVGGTIEWIVGNPGSGKSMMIRHFIVKNLKEKTDFLPILISLSDYSNIEDQNDFSIWLSIKILENLMIYLKKFNIKASIKTRIFKKSRKETPLNGDYDLLKINDLRQIIEQFKRIKEVGIEKVKQKAFTLKWKPLEAKDQKTYNITYNELIILPFDLLKETLLEIVIHLNKKILFLFDDLDYLARQSSMDYFIENIIRLRGINENIGIKVLMYRLILDKAIIKNTQLPTQKINPYDLSISRQFFNDKFRTEFLINILIKRLKKSSGSMTYDEIEKLVEGDTAIWWAAVGSMGNIRRFFMILNEAGIDKDTILGGGGLELNKVKNVIINSDPLFDKNLEESLKCIMPDRYKGGHDNLKKNLYEFIEKILEQMKAKKIKQSISLSEKIKKSIGDSIFFIELSKDFYDNYNDIILCLENSDVIYLREKKSFLSDSLNFYTYIIALSYLWKSNLVNKNRNTINKYFNEYRGEDRLLREQKEAREALITSIDPNDFEIFKNLSNIVKCGSCDLVLVPLSNGSFPTYCGRCGNMTNLNE